MTQTAQLIGTIPEALAAAAATSRGITLVDRDLNEHPLSYGDLADASARAAAGLRDLGVRPGDRICILGLTSPQLLITLFGAWHAGAVPVVLSLPRRVSDLDALVEDVVARCEKVEATVLAVSTMLLEQAPTIPFSGRIASIEEVASTQAEPIEPHPSEPGDLAYLQFTSGTTARSRAVELTHRHLLANMQAAGEMAGLDPEIDVFVSWLPLFHDMGLIGMLVGATIFGAPLVLIPTEEFLGRPGVWVDAMSRFKGTITAAPNFGYGLATRDLRSKPRDLDLSAWRIAANGAEPVDVETCERFAEVASTYGFDPNAMAPMFGLAEATLAVSLSRTDEPVKVEWVEREPLETEAKVVPCAPGTVGARAFVACGDPLPGHEVGEICVRGPSVMRGYWRDPEGTDEAIRDGWLHTGDLGFLGRHGVVVCGRKKDMIILGGRNLYPEDYEFFAERVPGVRRGNVIAFAISEIERMVVVAETTAEPHEVDGVAREALEVLRRSLPRGPEEVVLVAPGTLPKTSSGKRQRGACREWYSSDGFEPLAVAKR